MDSWPDIAAPLLQHSHLAGSRLPVSASVSRRHAMLWTEVSGGECFSWFLLRSQLPVCTNLGMGRQTIWEQSEIMRWCQNSPWHFCNFCNFCNFCTAKAWTMISLVTAVVSDNVIQATQDRKEKQKEAGTQWAAQCRLQAVLLTWVWPGHWQQMQSQL